MTFIFILSLLGLVALFNSIDYFGVSALIMVGVSAMCLFWVATGGGFVAVAVSVIAVAYTLMELVLYAFAKTLELSMKRKFQEL